jgi:arylsulfatase A-like enzyme
MAKSSDTTDQPNILVIFGDDIGVTNISAYSDGLMGYETPNIDRIGKEGIRFLHYYAEQSCTAGRAAFLTGQHGIRSGLTKVGYPGAPMGMSQLDPSIGGLLKNLGYATGQFGKNHVGDLNESLPTVNGFDEFLGNLYHLNAEEEPELPDYPKDPAYFAKFGPRGVPIRTIRRSIRVSAKSAGRRSKTPGRSPRSAWKPSTTKRRPPPSSLWSVKIKPESRSSAGSTRRACICARTCAPNIAAATNTATASTSTE